ncbi:MAG TPA: hypothetical protein VLA02_00185 [Reyranella sp.]|nr:hypothetical protein [Reyranella sp.]
MVSERRSLSFLIIDAIAFWLRHQAVFWLLALPIAGLAAAVAYTLDSSQQLNFHRYRWGWELFYALIYAMFLDRWIKESLLDGATACEEVDDLRRAMVPARLLLLAIVFSCFAMALGWLQLQGIAATLVRWGAPDWLMVIGATVLAWLPHLLVWATCLAFLAFVVPSWSSGAPLSLRRAWQLSGPARSRIFRLVVGAAFLSLLTYAVTEWGLEVLPHKAWATAAMEGSQRLADCLLLAITGHVLAALYRALTNWEPPEPEERPFRGMRLRPPAVSR